MSLPLKRIESENQKCIASMKRSKLSDSVYKYFFPNCLWKLILTYLDTQTLFLSISKINKYFNAFISKDFQCITSLALDSDTLITFEKDNLSTKSNHFFKKNHKIKKYTIYLKKKSAKSDKKLLRRILISVSYAKELKIISESHEIINYYFERHPIFNLKTLKIRITKAKANFESLVNLISNFDRDYYNSGKAKIPRMKSLKKISLSSDSFDYNNTKIDAFFQSVSNLDITEISIRPINIANPDTYYLLNIDNFSLKLMKLKLPVHIKFTAKAISGICYLLKNSKCLQCLCLNSEIVDKSNDFSLALKNNIVIRKLRLFDYIKNFYEVIVVLSSLKTTNIKYLSLLAHYDGFEGSNEFLLHLADIFRKNTIETILIDLKNAPLAYLNEVANLVVSAASCSLENFAKFKIKYFIYYQQFIPKVFPECCHYLFYQIFTEATRKSIGRAPSNLPELFFQNPIKFSTKNNVNRQNLSCLYYLLLPCCQSIKALSLKSIEIDLNNFLFLKILEVLPNLSKLKIFVSNNDSVDFLFFDALRKNSKNLKTLKLIFQSSGFNWGKNHSYWLTELNLKNISLYHLNFEDIQIFPISSNTKYLKLFKVCFQRDSFQNFIKSLVIPSALYGLDIQGISFEDADKSHFQQINSLLLILSAQPLLNYIRIQIDNLRKITDLNSYRLVIDESKRFINAHPALYDFSVHYNIGNNYILDYSLEIIRILKSSKINVLNFYDIRKENLEYLIEKKNLNQHEDREKAETIFNSVRIDNGVFSHAMQIILSELINENYGEKICKMVFNKGPETEKLYFNGFSNKLLINLNFYLNSLIYFSNLKFLSLEKIKINAAVSKVLLKILLQLPNCRKIALSDMNINLLQFYWLSSAVNLEVLKLSSVTFKNAGVFSLFYGLYESSKIRSLYLSNIKFIPCSKVNNIQLICNTFKNSNLTKLKIGGYSSLDASDCNYIIKSFENCKKICFYDKCENSAIYRLVELALKNSIQLKFNKKWWNIDKVKLKSCLSIKSEMISENELVFLGKIIDLGLLTNLKRIEIIDDCESDFSLLKPFEVILKKWGLRKRRLIYGE
ncbi:hypothetical protein SteCoe_37865 [Stentor coeruleus]|uniref:F-box domain-containing protein n=1 Tax=Stentor coeruleus TaxID=5963 RepID=A0A1R2AMA5_9CILI|nr:hypothetical protein SteCoe_37865 [Stentor coeruleus]